MADFVQGLDPSRLVLVETVLSFVVSPFIAPSYNFPIFLFGLYAQENTEAVLSLQVFSALLGASALFDIIWMFQNHQFWLIKVISVIIFFLKAPTFLAFASSLRARGAQFSGLGLRGNDVSGPTVWAMPGGFTSGGRDGYQNVDETPEPATARSPAPPSHPNQQLPQAPGAYQTV
ncbi:hypothetical protein EW146_g3726 [Bondarzewia mesenterica]|uniref:Uncharacterized protein n=1 Tax=Bondarzewia mesenterica TaxID=1095465 RepID=A0A4S4LWN2_9AGAM|nr:hypothetical protein EW146_g3726 [Bondarzewia mesenterica]